MLNNKDNKFLNINNNINNNKFLKYNMDMDKNGEINNMLSRANSSPNNNMLLKWTTNRSLKWTTNNNRSLLTNLSLLKFNNLNNNNLLINLNLHKFKVMIHLIKLLDPMNGLDKLKQINNWLNWLKKNWETALPTTWDMEEETKLIEIPEPNKLLPLTSLCDLSFVIYHMIKIKFKKKFLKNIFSN